MQEIEKQQLENIIVKRQQFGEQRYQLKTESLLFEQREQIQAAFQLIQDLMSSNQQNTNEFIQLTLTKNIPRIDKRGLEFYFEKSELEQVSNDSNLGLGLNLLLKENFDSQPNNKEQSIDFFQDEIFILELSLAQQYQYYSLSLQNEGKQKQQQFIKNIVKQQITQDPQFSVNNQKELLRKYSHQIKNQVPLSIQNKCRIVVFGLESQQNEFDQFYNKYNNDYYLNDLVLTTEKVAGQNSKKYNPFQIFNHLLRKENREIISYIHQNEYNQNELFNKLQELKFVENYNPLEIYFIVSQIVEDCYGICHWNKIIIHNIQYTDTNNTNENNQVLSEFEKYEKKLNEVYRQQYRRFQDDFLKFKDSTSCQKCIDNQQVCDECEKVLDLFQNSEPFDISNLDETKVLNKILYYKNDQGIALYSKIMLQMMVKKDEYPELPDITKYDNALQKQLSTHKNIVRHINYYAQLKTGYGEKFNQGEYGLLVQSDIEEGKKVFCFKFELKQSTKDFIKIYLDNQKNQLNQNKQNENKAYSLIQDYLIKIVAVKLKRIILNPQLRDKPYPPRQESQEKDKFDLKHYFI